MASRISFKQMQEDITNYIGGQVFLKADKVTDYEVSITIPANDVKLYNGNTLPKLQKENLKLIQVIDNDDILVGIAFVKSYNQTSDEYEIIAVEYGKGNFSIHKSSIDLDLVVDNEVTLTLTDINTTGITLKDLAVNQLVYDENKTVGFISSIDLTSNSFKVKTMTTDIISTGVKIYKYNNVLDNTIDNHDVINFSDLDVSTMPITELKEEQLVYDKNGSVAKITNINTTTNEIEVVTITTAGGVSVSTDRIKTNNFLSVNIGNTTQIPVSGLSETDITKLKENQIVFDSKGTVGYIASIDTTNNQIGVTTITIADGSLSTRILSNKELNKTILGNTTLNFTDLTTSLMISELVENLLVYDKDGTVAKIDNINTDTTTNVTTIKTTTLTTSSKSFEMNYYKYNKLLNKDVDTTQNILFSDISTILTINDLKENQIIFDEEGTISKIENIDTINNEVIVRIMTIDTTVTPIKSYKTTETLNATIGVQHLIGVPTGIIITDIEEEQLVYDDYGTLSKIISIDTTNNQLIVQTITGLGMPVAPNHKEAKIRKGGKNYQTNEVIETTTSGIFVKITEVDTNGTILSVLVDETATSATTVNGTDAEISYDQVIYGGYGNNWYQLADAAVMVAQTIAESFDFLQGYEYTITSGGTGYAIDDIIEIDTNIFVKVIEVDNTTGEIKKVAYTREDTQNTSGTGATITYTVSNDVFIIPGDRWNIGTAMFTLINDKGATVQFLRTEQNLVKYSIGEDGLYKFTFDNVDGIIYQEVSKISGSGDATLTEDVKSNLDVGNIKINDLFKTGTTFTDFVKKLLIKEILPTGKITAFKSGLNLKGTTVTTPLITAEILTLGDATIDTIEFYRGTNLEDTQAYVTGTNIYTFNTTDISSNETVSIKIHYTHKDGITKDTLTYSANYTFVNYSYFGLTNGIPTDTDIIGLSSNLKNTKAFTGTVNPVNQHIVYAYPEHLGSLTSIKDQNGFDYITNSYTKVTMTVNGEDYKVYYLTDPVTSNGLKQIYA